MNSEATFDNHFRSFFDEKVADSKLNVGTDFLGPLLRRRGGNPAFSILDAGCGDGVHLKILSDAFSQRKELVGLDISQVALDAARTKLKNAKVQWVHSNMMKIPFDANHFDAVYAFGSIAYSENPRLAFKELCRVTRPGGLIGLWVYPQQSGILNWLFGSARKFCSWVGPTGTKTLAHLLVPFLGWMPTKSQLSLKNASWKQCCEIVLVNLAPKQLSFPTEKEVESWFLENGIEIKERGTSITIWGEKK